MSKYANSFSLYDSADKYECHDDIEEIKKWCDSAGLEYSVNISIHPHMLMEAFREISFIVDFPDNETFLLFKTIFPYIKFDLLTVEVSLRLDKPK